MISHVAILLHFIVFPVIAQDARVHVDGGIDPDITETGTSAQPFNTVTEGVNAASAGQTISIAADTYGETMTIAKPMTLTATGGTVTIGNRDSNSFVEYLSVLSLNLRNIYNHPCKGERVVWSERYARIALWMAESGKQPDILALQEAPGWWWCPTNPTPLRDYEALAYLILSIKAVTNLNYRIAYLVGTATYRGEGGCGINGGPSMGGCQGWGGRALLYNVDRLRNVTGEAPDEQISHDDTTKVGVHLRRSLPCCNPTDLAVCELVDDPKQRDKCDRETGAGLAWVSSYYWPATSSTAIPAAFARFEILRHPGQFVHLYNVHVGTSNSVDEKIKEQENIQLQALSRDSTNQLISTMEERFAGNRLLPPIVLGDFNGGREQFEDRFDDAGWLSIDGVLIGKREIFPSTYSGRYGPKVQLPPNDSCSDLGEEQPARVPFLWSDHCAIYTLFLAQAP